MHSRRREHCKTVNSERDGQEYCASHAEYTRRSGNAVNSERGGPSPSMLSGEWRCCTILLHFFEGGREKNLAAILQIPGSGQPAPPNKKMKKGFAAKAAGTPGKPRPNPGESKFLI